jgi:hypothetical protein
VVTTVPTQSPIVKGPLKKVVVAPREEEVDGEEVEMNDRKRGTIYVPPAPVYGPPDFTYGPTVTAIATMTDTTVLATTM